MASIASRRLEQLKSGRTPSGAAWAVKNPPCHETVMTPNLQNPLADPQGRRGSPDVGCSTLALGKSRFVQCNPPPKDCPAQRKFKLQELFRAKTLVWDLFLCYFMLFSMLFYAILAYFVLFYAILCYFMLFPMLFYAVLSDFMLFYVNLCYFMLFHVIL